MLAAPSVARAMRLALATALAAVGLSCSGCSSSPARSTYLKVVEAGPSATGLGASLTHTQEERPLAFTMTRRDGYACFAWDHEPVVWLTGTTARISPNGLKSVLDRNGDVIAEMGGAYTVAFDQVFQNDSPCPRYYDDLALVIISATPEITHEPTG
jgi:hypothetical protein